MYPQYREELPFSSTSEDIKKAKVSKASTSNQDRQPSEDKTARDGASMGATLGALTRPAKINSKSSSNSPIQARSLREREI